MSEEPLKVVIIGFGLIGPRHAQAVVSNPSTTLIALVDPSPTSLSAATTFHVPLFPTISALLSSTTIAKPDAAIVCTPNHTHVPLAKELLSAGIHVLLEKPISDTLDAGYDLLQHAQLPENAHLVLLIGHHRRFNPYVRKTHEIVSSGALGRIIALNGLWTLLKPPTYFAPPNEWRRAAGVIPINLVHDVDVLHLLFGPIEGAALTLRFASGVVGTFLICDATPSPHNLEMGTGENPTIPKVQAGADFYRIFGSKASLSVPDMTRYSYEGRKEDEASWTGELVREEGFGGPVETERAPFDLQVQHFVDVIRGRVEPSCSATEGLRALVVCDAVKRAMETGTPVDVDVNLGV
ncbi:Glucose-fructose oxidoreductase, bacterial [Mycena venus]|uniref:Glucose-fructose oxidoreductase, bacterial n=1 Tax=Mycena venus TaxID=2733690 RepID=A0A8H6XKJ3_9AGAR|nr:Glucose-fructose oxidoreductase, bacterial [Mycena venus]